MAEGGPGQVAALTLTGGINFKDEVGLSPY